MQDDLARLEGIFGEAVAMADAAARTAYLDQACGDDVRLRDRVEALLAAHGVADDLLKLPDAASSADAAVDVSEGPGSTIGRYKLLEQIGEGGFGVVFMAEQDEPVRRKVALKIIKLGMDTRQVVARFQAERQALAMMDHPNIAKVFDAGATDAGRPYFVMELIRGIPITEYCDRETLGIPQRLRLFIQVCQAVQHAHQKGIIHRDLKPTNVLVTLLEDRPTPKIIDFGVAKATQGRLTERTMFTGFRQMIGTPAYMSPEQAQLSGIDVDTRSDVYSLGVLLYELLTGTTPLDAKQLLEAAFDEMQRIVREVEPPTPSTRLSGCEQLPSIAANRGVEPKQLAGLLRGELDWIVMKSLEKDRNRRYETANVLARDVENYLADEPVLACPPSTAYRVRKFVRRNRLVLGAAAALAAALVAGLAATTWMYLKEKDARRTAVAAEGRANSAATKSAQTAALLQEMLAGVGQSRTFQDVDLLQEILATASENPSAATTLTDAGTLLRTQGHFAEAAILLRRALAIQKKVRGDEHLEVAKSLNNLALVLWDQGKLAEAEKLARQGLAIAQKQPSPDELGSAVLLNNLGGVLRDEGRLQEAVDLLEQALATRTRLLGDKNPFTAESRYYLASVMRKQRRLEESEDLYRQALADLRADRMSDPGYLAFTLTGLAGALLDEKKYDDAATIARENLDLRAKNRPDDWQTFDARSLLGAALLGQQKYAEAESLLFAGYEGLERRLEMLPADGKRGVKEALERLVQLYQATGQADHAAQWQEKLNAFDAPPTDNEALNPQS